MQEQSDELDIGQGRRQQQYHLPLAMVTVTAIEVNFAVIGRLKSTSILAAFFFSTYIYDSKISLKYDRRCDIMMYLFVTVLRLAWLVVGVLVGVVVGHGHLA